MEDFHVVYSLVSGGIGYELKGVFTKQSDAAEMAENIGPRSVCVPQTLKQIKDQLLKEQLDGLHDVLLKILQATINTTSTGETK